MERAVNTLGAEKIYGITGIQFLPSDTLYQLCAASAHTPRILEQGKHLVMMPDLFHFWLTGKIACDNECLHNAVPGRANAPMVPRAFACPWCPDALPPALDRGRLGDRRPLTGDRRRAGTCRHDSNRARLPRYRFGFRLGGERWADGANQLRNLVAAGDGDARAGANGRSTPPEFHERRRRLRHGAPAEKYHRDVADRALPADLAQGKRESHSSGRIAGSRGRGTVRYLVDPDHSSFRLPESMPEAIAAFCASPASLRPPHRPPA